MAEIGDFPRCWDSIEVRDTDGYVHFLVTCPHCGALVREGSASTHAAWHGEFVEEVLR